jgi:hypothetical protein
MNLKRHLFNAINATILGTAGLAGLQSARAEDGALQVKGRVWANYTYDLTKDAGHQNGFDIYRAFLQADYKFSDEWSTTLLLDGARSTLPSNSLTNYVRNAYVQNSGLLGEGSTFRFGLQPTGYISTIDALMKTRWLGKNLVDQAGLVPSQDAGASLASKGEVLSYGVALRNGVEGLNSAGNSDNALSFDVWVGAKDLGVKGLGVTVYNSVASKPTKGLAGQSSNTLATALTLNQELVDAAVELSLFRQNKVNAIGYGVTLNLKATTGAALYTRFFTGDDNFKTGKLKAKNLLTVGPTYAFENGKVLTGLLFESASSNTNGANATRKILWNWAATF